MFSLTRKIEHHRQKDLEEVRQTYQEASQKISEAIEQETQEIRTGEERHMEHYCKSPVEYDHTCPEYWRAIEETIAYFDFDFRNVIHEDAWEVVDVRGYPEVLFDPEKINIEDLLSCAKERKQH